VFKHSKTPEEALMGSTKKTTRTIPTKKFLELWAATSRADGTMVDLWTRCNQLSTAMTIESCRARCYSLRNQLKKAGIGAEDLPKIPPMKKKADLTELFQAAFNGQ
jgi:hypothetical protein